MDEFFQFYFQRSDMPLLSHNAILEQHTTQIKSSMVSLFYYYSPNQFRQADYKLDDKIETVAYMGRRNSLLFIYHLTQAFF